MTRAHFWSVDPDFEGISVIAHKTNFEYTSFMGPVFIVQQYFLNEFYYATAIIAYTQLILLSCIFYAFFVLRWLFHELRERIACLGLDLCAE